MVILPHRRLHFRGGGPFGSAIIDAYSASLAHVWKLDEEGGNATDLIGGKTLTDIGTRGYTTGKDGNAFLGNGSSQALVIDETVWNVNQDWMLSAWVKTPASFAADYVFAAWNIASDWHSLAMDHNNSGASEVGCYDGSAKWQSIGTLLSSTWYHIFICRVGTSLHIYKNAALQGTLTVGTIVTPDNFVLGARKIVAGLGEYCAWAIDEVVIHENVTCSDVAAMAGALYNSGTGRFYTAP